MNSAKSAIDILFNDIDFNKFTRDTIEFYEEILSVYLTVFIDSYSNRQRRQICKDSILYLEEKVNSINDYIVRRSLYKSLTFSGALSIIGDLSKITTDYTYNDKQFLNKQFTKYGKFHMNELIQTVYIMNIKFLLPEILISISQCFKYLELTSDNEIQNNKIEEILTEKKEEINFIILTAFISYTDVIKQDHELVDAYEYFLELLIKFKNEQAAFILDEFRLH